MKTIIQEAIEAHLSDDEDIILADGFERAFVGIARQFGKPFAVYDRGLCLALLTGQEMSFEDAEEYMSFNTEGAWVGENTPAFMEFAPTDEEKRVEKFVSAIVQLTSAAELVTTRMEALENVVGMLSHLLKCYTESDGINHPPGAREAFAMAQQIMGK